MTNVSFYKLTGDQEMVFSLVCFLAQKAFNQNQCVLCTVTDDYLLGSLDTRLWDFQKSSFLPHGQGVKSFPIAVSCDSSPGEHDQILINLQSTVPTWFSRFDRVIEIIYDDKVYEQKKRDNFRFYKERGYPLSYHDLSGKFNL